MYGTMVKRSMRANSKDDACNMHSTNSHCPFFFQAQMIVKKFDGMTAKDAWKTANLDPEKLKDFVHECTTIIRQASQVDASKALAPVA